MVSVQFPSNGSTGPGYLAVPSSGSGIPVVVLQEWWGVDEHIRDVCHRFAVEGFVALAPDLYRGETTDQPDEAEQKMMALSMDQAERDMRGAVDFISDHEAAQTKTVGTVGFCLGGGLSVWAATANPKVKAAVVYYYVMPHGKPDFTKVNGPVLGHLGRATISSPRRTPRHSKGRCATQGSIRPSNTTKEGVTRSSTTPIGWAHTTNRQRSNRGRRHWTFCALTSPEQR